jgi:tetratricopeptide (TPR) repeat protein
MVLIVASCGHCGDSDDGDGDGGNATLAPPPSETEFFEPPPTRDALEEHVDSLLAEYEPRVDTSTQTAVAEWAQQFGNPAALGDPIDTADGYLAVGEMAFLYGSSSGAIWAFLQAVRLQFDNVYALSQLGFALEYEGRYDEARPFLLYANSLPERLHTVLVNLGYNYASVGELERCVAYLEQAAALQPDNGEIRHQLARCYFRAGWTGAGQDALDVAQRLAPGDPDIAQTAAHPPESEVEPTGEPNPLDIGGGGDNAGKLLEAVNTCQMEYLTAYGEEVAPYSSFGGAFDQREAEMNDQVVLHGQTAASCDLKCRQDFPPGGAQDLCLAGCYAVQCAADGASLEVFRRGILGDRAEWAGAHGSVTSLFAGCAWPQYFRLRSSAPTFEKNTVKEMIWTQLETAQEVRVDTWDDVDERVQLWQEDVINTCTEADAVAEDIDWENPVYFDPFKDLDVKICSPLADSFCVHMTNQSVSVTTPVTVGSPVNLEFSVDARTGKFNATLTVPIASKSAAGGTIEGGANLKLDMEKGVGVQTEGKIGGPLNKTWSSERFLFTPR